MERKKRINQLIKTLGESRVTLSEPLAIHTTMKIGGPAEIFFIARSREELVKAIKAAIENKIEYTILGGGTNVIMSDKGIAGLVIKNLSRQIKIIGRSGQIGSGKVKLKGANIAVDSGVLVNHLVRYTLNEGLAGLEHFLGQPGTVGGAVYINAHNMNKGVFFGDYIIGGQIITRKGEIKDVDAKYFQFGYDKSSIQHSGDTVLSVNLALEFGDKEELWQKAREAMAYRQRTQPLGIPSSGCIFRNISKADAFRLGTPNYTCSAGYLLDKAGLKGYRIGGAKFSEKHANFILNIDKASSKDVLSLIAMAKEKVKDKFGVDLQEEVVIL